MTDTAQKVPVTPTRYPTTPEPSKWTGWIVFAAVMMAIVGGFQIIEGLTALFRHTYYVVGHDNLLVRVDYTTWGWVHLIMGLVLLGTGLGLLTGRLWARILGVAVAGLSAIVNLAFIAAYPIWSILVISLDVIVIYAITVHGKELRNV